MFEVDENIAVALTPPREFYVNEEVFESLKAVFARSWQFVGDSGAEECGKYPPISNANPVTWTIRLF